IDRLTRHCIIARRSGRVRSGLEQPDCSFGGVPNLGRVELFSRLKCCTRVLGFRIAVDLDRFPEAAGEAEVLQPLLDAINGESRSIPSGTYGSSVHHPKEAGVTPVYAQHQESDLVNALFFVREKSADLPPGDRLLPSRAHGVYIGLGDRGD